MNIYNLFFRREQETKGEIPDTYSQELTVNFKKRFILYFKDEFSNHYTDRFEKIVHLLRKAFGVFSLNEFFSSKSYNNFEEISLCILESDDRISISTIELICRYSLYTIGKNFYQHTNFLLQYERIGYKFINEDDGFIVKIEDEQFFNECTVKSLGILASSRFNDALSHYINSYQKLSEGRYSDALVDIGRAIEALLKTRFTLLNIPFTDRDSLNKLLDIAQQHIVTQHHDFQHFKQIILDAGRARNTGGHGKAEGEAPLFDEVYVRFVINQAAANLLFLAETDMHNKKN